jgi:hypothetical protein
MPDSVCDRCHAAGRVLHLGGPRRLCKACYQRPYQNPGQPIQAADVGLLRKWTCCPMLACRQALLEAGGCWEKALEILWQRFTIKDSW